MFHFLCTVVYFVFLCICRDKELWNTFQALDNIMEVFSVFDNLHFIYFRFLAIYYIILAIYWYIFRYEDDEDLEADSGDKEVVSMATNLSVPLLQSLADEPQNTKAEDDAVEDEEEDCEFFDALENAGRGVEEDDNEVYALSSLPFRSDSRSRLESNEGERRKKKTVRWSDELEEVFIVPRKKRSLKQRFVGLFQACGCFKVKRRRRRYR